MTNPKTYSIQVLFSTMYQVDTSLTEKSNVYKNAVVVNQSDFSKFPDLQKENREMNMIYVSNEERGLSNSRNQAISLSNAEICLIADDDLVYFDDYESKVINAYKKFPDADIILFDFDESTGIRQRKSPKKNSGKINYIELLRGNSVRISFKKSRIEQNGIQFNSFFGSGSGYFQSGEDLIFLIDAYRKGLNIYYSNEKILRLKNDGRPSTWFNGYTESYFKTIGAFSLYYAKYLYPLYILQYLIRHPKQGNNYSFRKRWRMTLKGVKEYKQLSKG